MPIVLQLITLLAPMVRQAITDWKASHNGVDPTDAEIRDTLHANVQKVLAEGAAWRVAHGEAPAPAPVDPVVTPIRESVILLLQAVGSNASTLADVLIASNAVPPQ